MLGKTKGGNPRTRQSEQVPSTNDTSSDVPANEQQQNRIILFFDNGQKISAVPDGEANVTPEQRQKILGEMRSGKISWEDLENFLRNVAMPLTDSKEDVDKVFSQITQDLREKQILAVLTGHSATDWQTVSREDLKNLRGKPLKGQPNYRTPVGFAVFRQKFLSGIADKADAEQMQAYEQAMDNIERKIYGRRFEYYQQIRLMKYPDGTAANAAPEAPKAETITTNGSSAAPASAVTTDELPLAESTPTAEPALSPLATVQQAALTQDQSLALAEHALILGSPWKQDGREYPLTPASLIGNGLIPTVSLTMDDQTITLAQPFQLSDGRGAALGYVATAEGHKVRGFYLEPKSGLWHFAPDTIRGPRGEGLSRITEGYSLSSTLLPFFLQQKLTELVKSAGFREISTVNPDFLFAGTADAFDSTQEYRVELSRGQLTSDFYHEVDREPVVLNAQGGDKNKTLPQLLSANANVSPNFQEFVGNFATYSILAGIVQVNAFRSYDGSAIWLFCSDEYARTWIGGIEIISPLTSTGCRKTWAAGGDLLTALYETSTQAGGYGDPNDLRKGMVGMWNRYLSNVTLIREFLEWKNQPKI